MRERIEHFPTIFTPDVFHEHPSADMTSSKLRHTLALPPDELIASIVHCWMALTLPVTVFSSIHADRPSMHIHISGIPFVYLSLNFIK